MSTLGLNSELLACLILHVYVGRWPPHINHNIENTCDKGLVEGLEQK